MPWPLPDRLELTFGHFLLFLASGRPDKRRIYPTYAYIWILNTVKVLHIFTFALPKFSAHSNFPKLIPVTCVGTYQIISWHLIEEAVSNKILKRHYGNWTENWSQESCNWKSIQPIITHFGFICTLTRNMTGRMVLENWLALLSGCNFKITVDQNINSLLGFKEVFGVSFCRRLAVLLWILQVTSRTHQC